MAENQNDLTLRMLAKGRLAELRSLVAEDMDRDTARRIHCEVTEIAVKLSRKYKFEMRAERVKAMNLG